MPSSSLLSVIIPVYNCALFLHRNIEALQRQTLKDWVAIYINDGSTDNSREIIAKYAAADSRIIIVDKVNGGAASARNAGLDIAKTKYITMVDADDTISTDYLERMLIAATSTDCDIVVAASLVLGDDGKSTYNRPNHSGYMSASPYFLFRNIYRGPVAKLYRRDIIERYKLRMREDMIMAEDYVFVTSYWTRCKNIYSIAEPLYHYHYGENQNSLIHRFVRKELPFDVYRMNARAPWLTFRYLISVEQDKSVISQWTYELYRDLWKMCNNSCNYIDSDLIWTLRNECRSHEYEMWAYIPVLKRLFMLHRYPQLAAKLLSIKNKLKTLSSHR